jgi:hypothetical protein
MKKWKTIHKIATIIGGSMFGIATIAVSIPNSNMGRMLRAEVETPPSLDFTLPDEEDEETPPDLELSIDDDDDEQAPCEDGDLQSDDSEICEDGEFIECDEDAEGDTVLDGDKVCEDDEWVDSEEDEDEEAPDEDDSLIKITQHEADPDYFNPTTEETEIEYTISEDAILEITIVNISDQELVKLLDDEEVDEGSGEIIWLGTDDNTVGGTVLPAGVYKYKIKAKNVDTEATEDTEEGTVTLAYTEVAVEGDSEDPESETSTDNTSDSDTGSSSESDAIMAMTNTVSGETSETGPGVLIYSIFPVIGIFVARRKKGRQ